MPEEKMNQKFRLKKVEEIKKYLIQEINRNELMSKRHKKVCRNLNYVDYLLFMISIITWCTSISRFASLVGILIAITSSELKICVITAGTKKV